MTDSLIRMKVDRKTLVIAAAGVLTPAAAQADSVPGPAIGFFDVDSSVLTPEAVAQFENRLQSIILPRVAAGEITSIVVEGAADRTGTDGHNMSLSFRRAQTARNFLIGRGVPSRLITIEAHGENRLLVQTADDVPEPQNRYVIVTWRWIETAPSNPS